MLNLSNDQLTVDVLDPKHHQDLLGTRYCSGGYIYQVSDPLIGPLMSGPTYPETFNPFDGQGIPDSFSLAPLVSGTPLKSLIVGVGLCEPDRRTVLERCKWHIERHDSFITFSTRQSLEGWALDLKRRVSLNGRTVRSETSLKNIGSDRFSFVWFPHPFYPQLPTGLDALVKINIPVGMPANDGFALSSDGFIHRSRWPWIGAHYQALDLERSDSLVLIQRHPSLGLVTATASYAPTYFPIWGNDRTFSWEPMIERTLAPGQSARWHIDFDF